jgi:DUF4097 and DUF4098 domain-containing protein YvlB
MKRFHVFTFIMMITAMVFFATAPLLAQQVNPDRVTVAFSDPSRPGLLRVNVHDGSIKVRTHSGSDVIIEARSSRGGQNQAPPEAGGLRRLDVTTSGLVIEEENNVISVNGGGSSRRVDIEIQAPARINLNLRVHQGGDITVDDVEGEIEAQNHHGSVTLNNIAGSTVVNTHHGKVTASFRQVAANKPMALSSFQGNIDLTLPAATKANLKLRSDRGEIYSNFDVQVGRAAQPAPTKQGERYRLELDRALTGSINGGGAEIDLRTYHGNVYVRQGK